jgi:PAS domain S-box-containing protein
MSARSDSYAALVARLEESLVPEAAESILTSLAGAIFPSGFGTRDQVSWEGGNGHPGAAVPRETLSPEQRSIVQLRAAELRYRTLVEQIPAVTFMAVLGEGENEIYVSPHIEALLGFTQKEWLENPLLWFSQLHPDDQQLLYEEFARGCQTGGPFRAECRVLARDGRVVWIRGEARLIKDEFGRPLFLQGVAFDITESKQAQAILLEQAVRTTEERYRDIVEQLDAIFWEADPRTGRFTFVSRGAERILDYPAEDWIREPSLWISCVHADDRTYVRERWTALLRGGGDDEFEFRAETASGRSVWLQLRLHIPRSASADARAVGVMLDVTERKRSEEAAVRLAAIVDSTADAIVGKDLDGIITSWNPAAERMFGYQAAEVIGRSIRLVIPSDRQHEEDRVLNLVRRGERVANFETTRQRKDGTTFPAAVTVSPVTDVGGRIIGASKIARDITRQKQIEEQLRLNAARLENEAAIRRTLHRIGTELASELTLEHVVQLATDEATSLTGAQFGAFFYNVVNEQGEAYTLYTLSGVPREAFANFPMPRNTAVFGPTFSGNGVVRLDDVTKDPRYGRNAPYQGMPPGHLPVRSYLAVPVVSRSGGVLGGMFFGHAAVGSFTEEHEQLAVGIAGWTALAIDNAQLYATAEKARAAAESANRAKDEFLATMSHELRTPLNAVMGWIQVLRSGTGTPESRNRALATIERNARAQAQIIDDLLDVSRIVTGKFALKIAPVELLSVVDSALDTVNLAVRAKPLTLTKHIAVDSAIISGDADRLRQVVTNLLTNAVKFTPAGGHVTVSVNCDGTSARIEVADTGQGIDPALLPHVFDRFWQGDSSITRTHGGLGLGLAIVKHIVDMHGGNVSADSAGPRLGATFSVELPLAAHIRNERSEDGAGAIGPERLARLNVASIVVVDDEADSRELVTNVLEEAGARVRSAASVAEGLRAVYDEPPDLVICDLGMPYADGFDFLGQLRAMGGRFARTPAVALTAYAREEDRQRALAAGFQAHVGKPFDIALLLETVADLLSNSRDA